MEFLFVPMSNTDPLQLFFLALLPPQDLQASITAIKQDLADRFHCRHALKSPPHITLFPPFKWHQSEVDRLNCLGEFAQRRGAIPITLSGFGAFPPRVIFVQPLKSPQLLAIYQDLQTFLKDRLDLMDPMARKRAFRPHITLANRDLARTHFRAAWSELEGRSLQAEFVATHLTLLQHNGRQWEIGREWAFSDFRQLA